MKNKSLLTAVILFGLTTTTPTFANDGIYISGGINGTTQESSQSRNTGSNTPNIGASGGPSGTVVDKESNIGFVGGIGYKKHISSDFFVSAETFYSFENVDTTTLNNVKINNIELNSTYGGDLRLGTDVTEKVSIYGLIGATAHDIDSSISYTFAPPMDAVSDTVWGLTYGGGVEIGLTDRISTFGEFRIANDLSFNTPIDRGGVQANEDLNYTTVRTGLRFSF